MKAVLLDWDGNTVKELPLTENMWDVIVVHGKFLSVYLYDHFAWDVVYYKSATFTEINE